MRFGPVDLDHAEGSILAHSHALGDGRIRKGRLLDADDIARLRGAGLTQVIAATLSPGDVHEDEAAARLARALVPDPAIAGLRVGKAATGRVNLHAGVVGVLKVDVAAINAVNAIHPGITVATAAPWQKFGRGGGMAATIKIIPYAVPEDHLARVETLAQGALRICATRVRTIALIQSTIGDDDGTRGHAAIQARVADLGADYIGKTIVPHDSDALAGALASCGADLILILTGSATSDIDDVAPRAVRLAGGSVSRFGIPVDPGNLLFLGEVSGRAVIGLPGCARSPALNGADWVLERVACGHIPDAPEFAAMGVGGLLKEPPNRPHSRKQD